MSKIVTTKLGRFRAVIDVDKKYWLWECPHCHNWGNLSQQQWEGKTSVHCTNNVPMYYGLDAETDTKECGYHDMREFAKELVTTIQADILTGFNPFSEDTP